MQETKEMWIWSLAWENPLGSEMETHSIILVWKIFWTEENFKDTKITTDIPLYLNFKSNTYTQNIQMFLCKL